MSDYAAFLETKRALPQLVGVHHEQDAVHPMLFPFQQALTTWALRKGRAALFATTGMGKTFMQCEWARLIGGNVLILAPLSVANQTVGEAKKLGIHIQYARHQSEVDSQIVITNYEMADKFDPFFFNAVVLDESSILKALDGKTRQRLTEMFSQTPYRLCCTATPAPNDIAEIANHAEFLGVMTRTEMLSMFFVHDDSGWRLKKHAHDAFFRWLASWGMSLNLPSDLGFSDDGYILPPLTVTPEFVETQSKPIDTLFWMGLKGVGDRAKVRKQTMGERIGRAVELVNSDTSGDQWIVWCGLNNEGRELHRLIPDSVLLEGSMTPDEKEAGMENFLDGTHRVVITKLRLSGFGLNLQCAHKQVFVGLSDSWEQYYQGIRRSWRFGQTKPVDVWIVLSDAEREIYQNVMKKEAEAAKMSEHLIENVKQFEQEEIAEVAPTFTYAEREATGENYRLLLGDSAERLKELPDNSVDLSIFSPPFLSLFVYSPTERDLGNSKNEAEFFTHFQFIMDELLRVTKPGRNICVHVAQVAAMLNRDGFIGLKDFRGKTIQAFIDTGFVFHGEVCIDKDPQVQAIRTHSKSLLFVQMRKDSSWSRPGLADYILLFRKPGENAVPIHPDITNDEWILWARPIWYDISETGTLNTAVAKENDDERHIAPLQLETIERCIRLWSNKGETVFSPFAGIGSELYQALLLDRKAIGIELKSSYFETARRNLEQAVASRDRQPSLFDLASVS